MATEHTESLRFNYHSVIYKVNNIIYKSERYLIVYCKIL